MPIDTHSTAPQTSQALIAELLPYLRQRGFEPGERLPSERDLANSFQVSRNTMREALIVLEAVRVIERRPQSGVYLRRQGRDVSVDATVLEATAGIPMSPEAVRELNEFRSIMELQAIELACLRRDDGDLAAIDRVLEESARRLSAGESLAEQDAEFHLAVIAAARNQFLLRAANSFYLASRERRQFYFADATNARRSLAQHRRLRKAIAAADPDQAHECLVSHLGSVERFWTSRLPKPR